MSAQILDPKSAIAGKSGDPEEMATRGKQDDMIVLLLRMAPATSVVAITPSDTAVLPYLRSIRVGTGGDVVLTTNGVDVTAKNVADGETLPIAGATKLKATGTTASNILGYV